MRSPEGADYPSEGCYLEVVDGERLTWTNALEPGLRPARPSTGNSKECDDRIFTAVIMLASEGQGTRYAALAMQRNEAEWKRHEDVGFHERWGKALDQLVELVKSLT